LRQVPEGYRASKYGPRVGGGPLASPAGAADTLAAIRGRPPEGPEAHSADVPV